MDLVQTNGMTMAMAVALVDVGGVLENAVIRLFKNDVMPTQTSVTGDFTPTDYVGFGDQVITWLEPSISDDGTIEVIGTVPEFRPTNDVTPNDVFGALLLDDADIMLFGGRFEGAPLPMEKATDSILVTVRFRPADQSIAIVIS